MLLTTCGYYLTDAKLKQINTFLDTKNVSKIEYNHLIQILTFLKEIELANQQENEGDEYLDAFVALGGSPDRSGTVSKEVLIQIIKETFEMTIEMDSYLRGIGDNIDEIEYYNFCVLLDAGTGGNPSRVSSYLS